MLTLNFTFIKRWIFSVNHKDIGILYLIFGCFSGIIGTLVSFFFFLLPQLYAGKERISLMVSVLNV
jgi:heme/copper-type cytochrome/quinol oxidase subunit 1